MQKTRSFRAFALAICVAVIGHADAQVTQANNNPIFGSYVGHSGLNANPVEVRHNGNHRIEWYTDSLRRMFLSPTVQGISLNSYTNLDLSGRLGIGDFATDSVNQPLTLLHLDSMGNEVTGYRPWMGSGTLITKMNDMMYVGMMRSHDRNNRNDAVIGWSDNLEALAPFGPDRLRFIFTRWPEDEPTMQAEEIDGLEIARMIPDTSGNEGGPGLEGFSKPPQGFLKGTLRLS